MSQHRKFYHGVVAEHGTKVQTFKCDQCDSSFHKPSRLRRHMHLHSDVRNFICDICSSTFKTTSHLKVHKDSVHAHSHRFHCDKCGYGTMKRQSLKSHICGQVRRRKKFPFRHQLERGINMAENQEIHPESGSDTRNNKTKHGNNTKVNVCQLQYQDNIKISTEGSFSEGHCHTVTTTIASTSCIDPLLSSSNPASDSKVIAQENLHTKVNDRNVPFVSSELLPCSDRKVVSNTTESIYLAPNLHGPSPLPQISTSNLLHYSIPPTLAPGTEYGLTPTLSLPLCDTGTRIHTNNFHSKLQTLDLK